MSEGLTLSNNSFITIRTLRLALLTGVGLNLAMIGVRLFSYRSLIGMPGAFTLIVEPAVLLIMYALLVVWATGRSRTAYRIALLIGTVFGLITGGMQIVHLCLENFLNLSGGANGIIALAFMVGMFLLWGSAGYRAARRTGVFSAGLLAGVWSAMVSMLIAVMFGFALMNMSIPHAEDVARWPEFRSSGWTDAQAFAIANTLEAGFSHLLVGPIVGAVFGGIAGLLAQIGRKGSQEG